MNRKNRKLRKALLVLCCALALVAISVGATLAYLTDTEAVTNVFTVGKVGISLDEAKTDVDGNTLDKNDNKVGYNDAERISGNRSNDEQYTNKYHLIPGKKYTKDPIVHVDADSEDSWIFVKVENGLAAIENEGNATIASQITEKNGWKPLPGVSNVYYQAYDKDQTNKDLVVFRTFTLKGAGLVNGEKPEDYTGTDEFIGDYADANITVTAYAIQMAGFENKPEEAWKAGKFGETTNP